MAGSGKKRTTMAKLTRESRLRERRLDKMARKDARKLGPAYDPYAPPSDVLSATTGESDPPDSAPDGVEPQTHPDS